MKLLPLIVVISVFVIVLCDDYEEKHKKKSRIEDLKAAFKDAKFAVKVGSKHFAAHLFRKLANKFDKWANKYEAKRDEYIKEEDYKPEVKPDYKEEYKPDVKPDYKDKPEYKPDTKPDEYKPDLKPDEHKPDAKEEEDYLDIDERKPEKKKPKRELEAAEKDIKSDVQQLTTKTEERSNSTEGRVKVPKNIAEVIESLPKDSKLKEGILQFLKKSDTDSERKQQFLKSLEEKHALESKGIEGSISNLGENTTLQKEKPEKRSEIKENLKPDNSGQESTEFTPKEKQGIPENRPDYKPYNKVDENDEFKPDEKQHKPENRPEKESDRKGDWNNKLNDGHLHDLRPDEGRTTLRPNSGGLKIHRIEDSEEEGQEIGNNEPVTSRPKRQVDKDYKSVLRSITEKMNELSKGYASAIDHLKRQENLANDVKISKDISDRIEHLEKASSIVDDILKFLKTTANDSKRKQEDLDYLEKLYDVESKRIEGAKRITADKKIEAEPENPGIQPELDARDKALTIPDDRNQVLKTELDLTTKSTSNSFEEFDEP